MLQIQCKTVPFLGSDFGEQYDQQNFDCLYSLLSNRKQNGRTFIKVVALIVVNNVKIKVQ